MSKRVVLSAAFFSLAAFAWIAFSASSVSAIPAFKKAFESKYVKGDSTEANDVALKAAVEKSGCAICHMGKNKKSRNVYGKELGKLIKKSDGGDATKIDAALEKVAKMNSKPGDAKSPTFGDKISSGKLPAE
jgi:hypothetical protein